MYIIACIYTYIIYMCMCVFVHVYTYMYMCMHACNTFKIQVILYYNTCILRIGLSLCVYYYVCFRYSIIMYSFVTMLENIHCVHEIQNMCVCRWVCEWVSVCVCRWGREGGEWVSQSIPLPLLCITPTTTITTQLPSLPLHTKIIDCHPYPPSLLPLPLLTNQY